VNVIMAGTDPPTHVLQHVLMDVQLVLDQRPISVSHVDMDMLSTLTASPNVSHAKRKSFTTPTSTVQPQLSQDQLLDHACVNQTNGMMQTP
jgi:hypothetical protein